MTTEKKVWTIGELLQVTVDFLQKKGIESARLDAEVLLSAVLQKQRIFLYVHFDEPLNEQELALYRQYIKERSQHRPVAYILGEKEFMGMDFQVNEHTLIPRPDTEILIEKVINAFKPTDTFHILDLGTGSGAIIISLLKHFPNAHGTAVDISPEALAVAKANAQKHDVASRLEFIHSDMFTAVDKKTYHLIVSNPPYIPIQAMADLEKDVKDYEPHLALTDQGNGLKYYEEIFAKAQSYLQTPGMVAVEIGIDQDQAVSQLAHNHNWQEVEITPDYSGIPRVVSAWKK